MDIHSAIKFGVKTNTKTPQEPLEVPTKMAEPKHENEAKIAQKTNEHKMSEQSNVPASTMPKPQTPPTPTTQQAPKPPTQAKPAQTPNEKPASTPVSFKTVDLSIGGTNHRINCPVEEVAQLEQAGEFINDKIREIRQGTKGKNLSNEELLVLICLELYDNQESLRVERRNQLSDNERAKALIEKINENARSVL